jgi:hypothetical protein
MKAANQEAELELSEMQDSGVGVERLTGGQPRVENGELIVGTTPPGATHDAVIFIDGQGENIA